MNNEVKEKIGRLNSNTLGLFIFIVVLWGINFSLTIQNNKRIDANHRSISRFMLVTPTYNTITREND